MRSHGGSAAPRLTSQSKRRGLRTYITPTAQLARAFEAAFAERKAPDELSVESSPASFATDGCIKDAVVVANGRCYYRDDVLWLKQPAATNSPYVWFEPFELQQPIEASSQNMLRCHAYMNLFCTVNIQSHAPLPCVAMQMSKVLSARCMRC